MRCRVGDPTGVQPGSSASKREPRLAVVVGLAVVILALLAGGTLALVRRSGLSEKGLSGAQILERSLAVARKAGTVHVDAAYGDADWDSMDISANGGIDTSTVDGGTITIIDVGGHLYFQADAFYWTGQFDAPESVADHYAGKWVVTPTDHQQLNLVAEELEMPTIVDKLLALSGPISKGRARANGQFSLSGAVPDNEFTKEGGAGDSATLIVSSTSPLLPLSISYTDPQNGTTRMTFSKWGEQVPLAPPPSPLSLPGGATLPGA